MLGSDARFPILDASDGYLRATFTEREAVIGRGIFEVLPTAPTRPARPASRTCARRSSACSPRVPPTSWRSRKYDIRRPAAHGGSFVERYWSPVNAPVLSSTGDSLWLVHRVEDVTELTRVNAQLREASEQFHAVYDPAGPDRAIFERFRRVDGAKGRTYEGSGICLALVDELVRLHRGTIRVDSVEHAGTARPGWQEAVAGCEIDVRPRHGATNWRCGTTWIHVRSAVACAWLMSLAWSTVS